MAPVTILASLYVASSHANTLEFITSQLVGHNIFHACLYISLCVPTYRVQNYVTYVVAMLKALEWVGTSKAQLLCRCETSDLSGQETFNCVPLAAAILHISKPFVPLFLSVLSPGPHQPEQAPHQGDHH